jgi:tetratricopeptide (TPR) repeat protein
MKYQEAINVQFSLGEAHYNLGLALYRRSLYAEARPHFKKAAQLEPFNEVIWNAPPFRKYGTVEPNTPPPAPDGHFGHQH